MEHYDNQNRLHCYEENSQGPCEDGKIFVQPDDEDEKSALKGPVCIDNFELRRPVMSGNGFGKKCSNGKRYDRTTGKCKKTSRHGKKSNKRSSIGRHKNVVNFLRNRKKRQGRR